MLLLGAKKSFIVNLFTDCFRRLSSVLSFMYKKSCRFTCYVSRKVYERLCAKIVIQLNLQQKFYLVIDIFRPLIESKMP